MSKGHMEALAALKAMRAKSGAKPLSISIQTKHTSFKQVLPLVDVTKLSPVTKLAKGKGGRPKIHASAADRQRASRAKKAARAGT